MEGDLCPGRRHADNVQQRPNLAKARPAAFEAKSGSEDMSLSRSNT